jgi:succinoglycan biosynthesis transport protein ExoP
MSTPAPPEVSVKDYLDVLRRRKSILIQVFVLVMAVGAVVTLLARPVYQTSAKLLVPTSAASINLVDAKNPLSAVMASYQPESITTQMELLQAGPFIGNAMREAGVQPRPSIEPPSVKVENVPETSIIQVTVEGGDPKEITNLANTILKLHQQETEVWSSQGVKKTLDMTRDEKEKAKEALDAANRKLLAFRQAHRVVQLTADQQAQAKEYVELQSRVGAAQSNITTLRAQVDNLRARIRTEPVDLVEETTRDNPRVATLQAKLDDLGLQREDLLRELRPTHRQVKDLDAQIASLKARLDAEPRDLRVRTHTPNPVRPTLQAKLAELEASLQGAEADFNAAKAEFKTKSSLVDQLAPWEVELTRLTAERDGAMAAYTQFSEAERDLAIRDRAELPGARVIQKAFEPSTPVRPRKSTNLMLTAVLALALGVAMAFLQEFLDDRVNSPDDLERISAIPTLGHVPLMAGTDTKLVSALPANSHVAESYRALRSSIGFAGIDAPIRRLQVTSASKGEGKTITSINLATAMAMDGKRVILVDADMRRPSLHRVLQLPSAPGLSDLLAGNHLVDDAIQETEVENLRIITAGPIPPNPAELLGSRRFDQLLQELEDRADVVIYDTPPCLPVTDPLIIAGRMEGVVLVLHVGQTRKAAVKHAEEMLTRARARIIGIIFNRVQQNKGGYYYHHYYYHYGDGYYADTATRGSKARSNGKPLPGAGPQGSRDTALTPRYRPEDEVD